MIERPTLYVLDYNKITNYSHYKEVINDYESFRWIERFSGQGEFELKVPWNIKNMNLFSVGTFLSLDRSHRIMRVESYKLEYGSKERVIILKGNSLEDIFNYRHVRRRVYGTSEDAGTRYIPRSNPPVTTYSHYRYVMSDSYSVERRLGQSPLENVAAYSTSIPPMYSSSYVGKEFEYTALTVEPGTLQSFFDKMYNNFRIGVAYLRNPNSGQLCFWVIRGRDRSEYSDSAGPAIIFEEQKGDLSSVEKLVTEKDEVSATVHIADSAWAYWQSTRIGHNPIDLKYDLVLVHPDEDEESLTREDLIEMASDHVSPRGFQTLYSAETSGHRRYVYDIDYLLGDVVGITDPEGGVVKVRVVEYSFIYDPSEGYSEHPTFEDLNN